MVHLFTEQKLVDVGKLISFGNVLVREITWHSAYLVYNLDPLIEQHKNFPWQIFLGKNNFKSVVQKDITVSLLIDEIRLKSYFEYEC